RHFRSRQPRGHDPCRCHDLHGAAWGRRPGVPIRRNGAHRTLVGRHARRRALRRAWQLLERAARTLRPRGSDRISPPARAVLEERLPRRLVDAIPVGLAYFSCIRAKRADLAYVRGGVATPSSALAAYLK